MVSPHNSARIFLAPAVVSRVIFPAGIVGEVTKWLLTFALVVLALAGAWAVAYGTQPSLILREGGLETIMLARRYQWPLVAISLVASVALIGMVVAGASRAWWLIALAPVLFLHYQRFAGDSWRRLSLTENPPWVTADKARFLDPKSPVIGLRVGDSSFAYPCGSLLRTPIVLHTEADKRILVLYNPYAGRAHAFYVDHTVKVREFDIVSMPANAMLIYNARIGQFINAFTGLTPSGHKPAGFVEHLATTRTTWQQWRAAHEDTRVLNTPYTAAGDTTRPIFPYRPAPAGAMSPETRVTLLATSKPVVLRADKLLGHGEILNASAGNTPLLLVRDEKRLRVFDRCVKDDLFLQFQRRTDPQRRDVRYLDLDSKSLWNAEFHCVHGPLKGQHLKPIAFEEDLPWGTVQAFIRDVEFLKPEIAARPARP